jgi:hypothetical protein
MKVVVATNKQLPIAVQINAASHLCLGMHAQVSNGTLAISSFYDPEGRLTSVLSDLPLIVMVARNSNHLHRAHLAARSGGLVCNAFFGVMLSRSVEEQQALISERQLEEQEYIGLSILGEDAELRILTRQFSLMSINLENKDG